MAVVKISELVALTAPAADDIMVVNDVSEVAEADRTKKIRMDDIGIFEASQLATGIVTNTKLGADAVTGAKIADDAVDSEHIAAGAIDTEHIASAQVTPVKTSFFPMDTTEWSVSKLIYIRIHQLTGTIDVCSDDESNWLAEPISTGVVKFGTKATGDYSGCPFDFVAMARYLTTPLTCWCSGQSSGGDYFYSREVRVTNLSGTLVDAYINIFVWLYDQA